MTDQHTLHLLAARLREGEDVRCVPRHADYHITSHGRVLSTKYGKVRELVQDYGSGQAPRVTLSNADVQHRYIVARLVAQVFLGPRRGRLVIHRNGDTNDNRLANLRYGTRADLGRVAVAVPTVCHGEAQHLAKLDSRKVRIIRALVKHGATLRSVAHRFGVSHPAIGQIVHGRAWRRVI